MYDLLENWLRHKSDMVNIEAARAICDMRNVTATELYRPVAGSFSPSFPLSHTFSSSPELTRSRSIFSFVPLSSPTLPHLPETRSQVRRHPNAQQARTISPRRRRFVQPRDGEHDHRSEPIHGYLRYHHSPQGSSASPFPFSIDTRPSSSRPSLLCSSPTLTAVLPLRSSRPEPSNPLTDS